jgi:hypothetical protein
MLASMLKEGVVVGDGAVSNETLGWQLPDEEGVPLSDEGVALWRVHVIVDT